MAGLGVQHREQVLLVKIWRSCSSAPHVGTQRKSTAWLKCSHRARVLGAQLLAQKGHYVWSSWSLGADGEEYRHLR